MSTNPENPLGPEIAGMPLENNERLTKIIKKFGWAYYVVCSLACTVFGYISLGKMGLTIGMIAAVLIGIATHKGLSLFKTP